MKQNKYILLATALAATAMFSGCITDNSVVPPTSPTDGSVSLNISMPDPVPRDMGTRAGVGDFDVLTDLNIVIAEGNDIRSILFFRFDGLSDGQAIGGTNHVVYYARGNDVRGNSVHGIHFSKTWLDYAEIDGENADFYIVANYGRDITGEADTVEELKKLKEYGVGGRIDQHVMFGRSVEFSNPAHDTTSEDSDHEGGRSLRVEMKRTAAMITVAIDGRGLNEGVVITPLSVSLHNVPAWCVLDGYNIITQEGGIAPLAGAVFANGDALDAVTDLQWGSLASPESGLEYTVPTLGAHYTDAPASVAAPDYSRTDIRPLFLFENWHGPDFGEQPNTDQINKRPKGVDPNPEAIGNSTGACSYLRITARYNDSSSNPQKYGDVTYRVFLGKDITENFDVERNTYYRFTLDLNGSAISEDDYSWRVETNISSIEVSDADFNLNGNGTLVNLDIFAGHKQWICNVRGDDDLGRNPWFEANNQPFVWIGNDAGGWLSLSQTHGSNIKMVPLPAAPGYPEGGNRAWLYVAPMIRGESWNGANTWRRVIFRCLVQGGSSRQSTPWITITQHEPLVRRIDEQSPPDAQAWVTTTLGKALPVDILFDRIDRDALPWGYETTMVTENQPSGFENGYSLTLAEPGRALTPGYLAQGPLVNSAMFSAATQHLYHDADTESVLDLPFTTTSRPAAGEYAYAIPSVSEWKMLEELHGETPLFDSMFPLEPWTPYWTSDAVEESSTLSYLYRVRQGDDGVEPVDRVTPARYRMMYIMAPVAQ